MRSFSWQHLCLSSCIGALFSGLIAAVPVSAFQEVVKEKPKEKPVAEAVLGSRDVTFVPTLPEKYEYLRLTVGTPTGKVLFGEIPFGENPVFSLAGTDQLEQEVLDNGRGDEEKKPEDRNFFPDGTYKLEVRPMPSGTQQTQTMTVYVENGKILPPEKEPGSESATSR